MFHIQKPTKQSYILRVDCPSVTYWDLRAFHLTFCALTFIFGELPPLVLVGRRPLQLMVLLLLGRNVYRSRLQELRTDMFRQTVVECFLMESYNSISNVPSVNDLINQFKAFSFIILKLGVNISLTLWRQSEQSLAWSGFGDADEDDEERKWSSCRKYEDSVSPPRTRSSSWKGIFGGHKSAGPPSAAFDFTSGMLT